MNMFPDTITIYHHTNDGENDIYTKQIVNGFYAMRSKSLLNGEKGASKTNATSIISSPQKAKEYGVKWTVQLKDRIVFGKGKDITNFSQLTDAITVNNISINLVGSDVDNITISGV